MGCVAVSFKARNVRPILTVWSIRHDGSVCRPC